MLAIVYGLVKQHNGYINVYSEPGKGTTFKIYLPLIESVIEKAASEIHTVPKGGTETILIAEDEPEVRTFTRIALERFGYKIIEASDGEDAVNKLMESKNGIGLLILDVIMPKKNGREAYDAIKKIRPDVKAIFTSGYARDILDKKIILDEGLHFVSKPVSPTELLRKVREVLDNSYHHTKR